MRITPDLWYSTFRRPTPLRGKICKFQTKSNRGNQPHYLKLPDLSRICQVDLKTIHNWADRDHIPHFRTPGRHLRFRRLDVVEFLKKYGYAIPTYLQQAKPRLVLIEPDARTLESLKAALSAGFEVHGYTDPIDALVLVSTIKPECVVVDSAIANFDVVHFIERFKSHPNTQHIRSVVLTNDAGMQSRMTAMGVTVLPINENLGELIETVQRVTGFTPANQA